MFNRIYVMLAAILPTIAQAQITYEATDFSAVGQPYVLSEAATLTGFNFAAAGPGVAWDYSSLTANSQSIFSYQNPNDAGYKLVWCLANFFFFNCNSQFNSNFTHAQVALDDIEFNGIALSNIVEHARRNASTFENRMRGLTVSFQGQSIPVAVDYDDPDELYNFPMAFGNTNVNTAHFLVELLDFNVPFSYELTSQRTNTVEGWGSLVTPYGTFTNVLKLKTVLQSTEVITVQDNTFPINTTRVFYQWFDKAFGIPVLQAEGFSLFGNYIPTRVTYLDVPSCQDPAPDFASFASPYNVETSSALVAFASTGSNYNSATWDFGDGTTGNGLNTVHEYNCPGEYLVTLNVANTICQPPIAATITLPVEVLDSQNVLSTEVTTDSAGLTAVRSAEGTTYQWVDCNNNNAALPGAVNQVFQPSQSGTYACILDTNGCQAVTDCVAFEVLSTEQPNLAGLQIYPNPTSGVISVVPASTNYQVEIFNSMGRLVAKSLDLTGFAAGFYLVRLQTPEGILLRKIIKQ